MNFTRLFEICLDVLLPRTCVLCETPLALAGGAWPVCGECSAALRPLSGERCERCGLPLISERGLCMRCRGAESACDSIFPLFSYTGKVGELVACYKLKRRRSLAPFIAGLYARAYEGAWSDRIIVPVPPRPEKTRLQGWDQVEEVARLLERRGFAVARPLERRRSDEQKSLGRGARGPNAKRAYALKPGAASPRLPLLIDDVVTTGATLDSCARVLKASGAASVVALVLAAD